MYDYGARMYMPDIGRWGVVDPRSENTKKTYSYVWNNPINFWDPTGMEGESVNFSKDIIGGTDGGLGNGIQATDCCNGEFAPNKPGGVNNPVTIEEVVITAPAKSSSNSSFSNSSGQLQLSGVSTVPAVVQVYPIYQAVMWAIGAIATYKVAEKAKDVIINPPTFGTIGDDDMLGVIDIEGVVIPGMKKIDDSGIKVPVDVLGGLRVNFAQNRGERGFTRNPSGTDNPYKHVKPDTKKPGNVVYKHPQSGKKVSRPATPGEKEHFGLK